MLLERWSQLPQIGKFVNSGVAEFDPPGKKQNGNNWVLIIDGDISLK